VNICLTSSTIERIAFRATIENAVPDDGCVQQKLNKLAESSDFKKILKGVVKKRKLVLNDVRKYVPTIYNNLPRHLGQPSVPILLQGDERTTGELVVLFSFFRLPAVLRWTKGLDWGDCWDVCWDSGQQDVRKQE
jgi:hypothetical protein